MNWSPTLSVYVYVKKCAREEMCITMWNMSDLNAPIQIPSELNVPETTVDNDKIEPIKPKSAIPISAPQSADGKSFPKHRLRKETKSHSMFNFSSAEPTSEETTKEEKVDEEGPPTICLCPPSAKSRQSCDHKSTDSFDRIDKLTDQAATLQISASTNEMKLSANRMRANSLAVPDQTGRDNDEFDALGANGHTGSQLRIRSSIISLFGRMGKMRRRSSNASQNSKDNGESNNRAPPLRALPQIAATKIMRAFSYVGKLCWI